MNERFFENPLSFIPEGDNDLSIPMTQSVPFATLTGAASPGGPPVDKTASEARPPQSPAAARPQGGTAPSLFGGKSFSIGPLGVDDLLILGLIVILFMEDRERNKDVMVLLAVLFFAGLLF